jgi:hypothetical protein
VHPAFVYLICLFNDAIRISNSIASRETTASEKKKTVRKAVEWSGLSFV